MRTSRRDALTTLLAGPLAAALIRPARAQDRLALTPACADADAPTPAQTEGPYFTPDTPLKTDFVADSPGGRRIALAGFVLDVGCRPQPEALIELWHADETGAYDNRGYRLRGHRFADAAGRWGFETIVPGLYPGRTRHFHLKVQRRGGPALTTQLYFPGEPANARDGIFDDRLLLALTGSDDAILGRYDFVLA